MYQTVRHLLDEGIPREKLWWLRLDHPLLLQVPLDVMVRSAVESTSATGSEPVYMFLDELVYAKDWDLWLKTFYDEKRPIRLAGSSSSTAALRHRRLESGIGRWEEQYLAPYLFSEYLDLERMKVEISVEEDLATTIDVAIRKRINTGGLELPRHRYLLTGGFPELLIDRGSESEDAESMLLRSQRTLRSDSVERAIYKDIPQAFGGLNPMLLERMLYTLAGQVTGILSPSTLCKNLDGLTQPTFDRYLTYLERAFMVFTLSNYSGSESSRQRRGRKLYFIDGAIRNAALQRGIAPLRDSSEMGLLTENMVAAHLHALSLQTLVRLYHWREKNDEIDLIYDHPSHPLALEVASSATHSRRGLLRFVKRFPRFAGRCFLVAPDAPAMLPSDTSDSVGLIPLDLLLLCVGAQAETTLKQRLQG